MTATLTPPSATSRRALRPPRPARIRTEPTPRSPRKKPAPDPGASVVASSLTMLALISLWVVAQTLFLGSLSQDRAQQLLYSDFRTQLAGATAPIGPIVPVGDPVALLTIPSLGLQQVVVEGTASGDTLAGPGHLRDTPLPGQEGTSVVFGRAVTYGGPFERLTEMRRGDKISVVSAQGRLGFTVIGVRRAGDSLPTPPAAGRARLTLVTAEGQGRLAALSPSSVFYVDAEATKAFPAPSGRPTSVPQSEQVMARDPGAVPLLALCLALLLAMTLGVIAARQRWSTALVWVVASPLVLALSWVSTDVVMRLLPNLI